MFENLGQKIADLGNTVAAGASNVMDNTKRNFNNFSENLSLKNKIENAKKEIYNTYASIGEKYFMENRSNIPEGYEELFARIEENERLIAQAEEELRALNAEKICPQCGASVKKEFNFCTVCGSKLEKPVEPENTAQKICPNCGNNTQADAAFCNMCGSKLD